MRDYENGYANMSGLIMGTIIGAAIGAGMVLLFAPRSGRETRKLIAQGARGVKEKALLALEQGKHAMRREVENVAMSQEGPTRTMHHS